MNEAETTNWLKSPAPHPHSKREWVVLISLIALFVGLWFAAGSSYSEQPESIKPAPITSGEGVQAVIRANQFNSNTGDLGLLVSLTGVGGLVDSRGMLTHSMALRVETDEGNNLIRLDKGEPLVGQEVMVKADGDVNQYPFDKYHAEIVLLAEKTHADGTFEPLTLSIGTEHAETGWYTDYEMSSEASDEAKITIVSMHREPFQIDFTILLSAIILVLGLMAIIVGYLSITNRRPSDGNVIGWMVGLLFALPFARRILPGDPPMGVALDVRVYSWAMLFCTISVVLATISWLRQSRAAQS